MRWIRPGDFHITLRFFGEMPEPVAADLVQSLQNIKMQPFDICFEKAGWFGRRKASSIHLRVEHNGELDLLHYRHEMLARDLGFAAVSQNYTPHVTLGRLHNTPKYQLEDFIADHATLELAAFRVDSFALFSAKPSGGGGPYVVEERYEC